MRPWEKRLATVLGTLLCCIYLAALFSPWITVAIWVLEGLFG